MAVGSRRKTRSTPTLLCHGGSASIDGIGGRETDSPTIRTDGRARDALLTHLVSGRRSCRSRLEPSWPRQLADLSRRSSASTAAASWRRRVRRPTRRRSGVSSGLPAAGDGRGSADRGLFISTDSLRYISASSPVVRAVTSSPAFVRLTFDQRHRCDTPHPGPALSTPSPSDRRAGACPLSVSSHSVRTQSACATPSATIPKGSSPSNRVPQTAQRVSALRRSSARTIHPRTLIGRHQPESCQNVCRLSTMSIQLNPVGPKTISSHTRHCSSAYIEQGTKRSIGRS